MNWLCDPNIRFNFPPNHTSFVLYYPKCCCKCFYCDLNKIFIDTLPFEKSYLEDSLDFIDTIVVSGGEPLLAFEDVLKFQQMAIDNDLYFYVYTCGFDCSKIQQLLDNYDRTYIVIDVKGSGIEEISKTTRTSLKFSQQIHETYQTLKYHSRVTFRLNEHTKPLKSVFRNVELYSLIK